jgi:hypothetical protein
MERPAMIPEDWMKVLRFIMFDLRISLAWVLVAVAATVKVGNLEKLALRSCDKNHFTGNAVFKSPEVHFS